MDVVETDSPLQYSFRLLQDAVEAMYSRGKKAYSAGLKPELQSRTNGTFSERILGFESFKAFLEAAADRGLIQLRPSPTGPATEVEALPVGIESELSPNRETASSESTDGTPRPLSVRSKIRRDLWECFVDWRPGNTRLFDLEEKKAFLFPTAETPFDPTNVQRVRREWQANPSRFREIAPISAEEQVQWMREFADELEDPTLKDELSSALGNARPTGSFARLVRGTPRLASQWYPRLYEKVSEVIQRWLETEQIPDVAILVPADSQRRIERSRSTFAVNERRATRPHLRRESDAAEIVRARLQMAIQRMPLSELLKLQIPIEYLL